VSKRDKHAGAAATRPATIGTLAAALGGLCSADISSGANANPREHEPAPHRGGVKPLDSPT